MPKRKSVHKVAWGVYLLTGVTEPPNASLRAWVVLERYVAGLESRERVKVAAEQVDGGVR